MKHPLTIFIDRMKKIGIEIKLLGNYPWVYIQSINNNRVKEEDYYLGNHGFTIMFQKIKPTQKEEFTNISLIFKLIRKYK